MAVGFVEPEKDEAYPEEKADDDVSAPMPKRTKSFASKSLGEADKTGVQITLFDLTYRVPVGKGEERYLLGGLEPLSGTLDPGQMVALMGSSGAGKSTLMDVISKRKTVGVVEGLVLFDGHVPTHGEIGRDTGYVEQKDTLWGVFTVYEMLMYTALLKMDAKFNRKQKAARVDEVIEQMGLGKSRNTKIGGAMVRGVSGGEAKRISIGLGLLNNPRVLFLDEPTSGLDSAIAHDIMSRVKDLANEGRTVLSTIHQPSGRTFALFDSIILLSKDQETDSGNIVYFGGAGSTVLHYFEELGYVYSRKNDDNIPSYLVNIIGGGVRGPKEASFELFDIYYNSESHKSSRSASKKLVSDIKQSNGHVLIESKSKKQDSYFSNSIIQEILILLQFNGRSHFRDAFFLASRIGTFVLAALLLISLYTLPKGKTPTGLQTVVTMMFVVVLLSSFMSIIMVATIILEKPIFVRERQDACYRTISYCTSFVILEAASRIISCVLFSCILYWVIPGMNPSAGAFFFFILAEILTNWTATHITLTFGNLLPSIEISAGAIAIYGLMNIAIMGFLSPVPLWWGWATFVSYTQWAFGAFMINQFTDYYFPFCEDVKDPFSVTDLLTMLTNMTFIEEQALSGKLNADNIICGILAVQSNSSQVIADECPAITSSNLVDFGNPAALENSLQSVLGCTPAIAELIASSTSGIEKIYSNVGYVFLSTFPQGDNYASKRKFIDYNQWECLGYLSLLCLFFYMTYVLATMASLSMVKR